MLHRLGWNPWSWVLRVFCAWTVATTTANVGGRPALADNHTTEVIQGDTKGAATTQPAATDSRVARDTTDNPGKSADREREVRVVRSEHFILRSDLNPMAADELLQELEGSLSRMAAYWQRPLRANVECVVVDDPGTWSQTVFPNRRALHVLGKIGGYTESRRVRVGHRIITRSRVYAKADPGIVRHEITHAYQDNAFADVKVPLWYKEGMAELMSYESPLTSAAANSVQCRTEMMHYLTNADVRQVRDITGELRFTSGIAKSVVRVCRGDGGLHVAANAWGPADDAVFRDARESYSWAWALCHLLYHHPAYQTRFRLLGQSYMTHEAKAFDELFQPVLGRIDFELEQFVRHLETGYRVDLCCWDWDAPFRPLEPDTAHACHVIAARGYQPAGVVVEAGRRYAFDTRGTWRTGPVGQAVPACGNAQGVGRLVAVVMEGMDVSQEFSLGQRGTFVAPRSGKLHVRCQDAWGSLADNAGRIALQVSRPE